MYLYVNKKHSKSKEKLIDEIEDIQVAMYSINMSKPEPDDNEKFIDGIIPEKLKMLEDRKVYLEKTVKKAICSNQRVILTIEKADLLCQKEIINGNTAKMTARYIMTLMLAKTIYACMQIRLIRTHGWECMRQINVL